MRGVVMYGPRDVRVEGVKDPTIVMSTDAIIRLSVTCICGSDLWPYRGADLIIDPMHMGHEYVPLGDGRAPGHQGPPPTLTDPRLSCRPEGSRCPS